MININDTVQNHFKVHRSASLLDVLIEFDKFLDDLNVYSYENWLDGEIIDGPHLSRYWCEISMMFPYKKMPDPAGGKRLTDKGCKVSYAKDELLKPRQIKSPADYRPGTTKGKIDAHPIWVVEIKMPKQLIGNFKHGKDEIETTDATDVGGTDLDSIDAVN